MARSTATHSERSVRSVVAAVTGRLQLQLLAEHPCRLSTHMGCAGWRQPAPGKTPSSPAPRPGLPGKEPCGRPPRHDPGPFPRRGRLGSPWKLGAAAPGPTEKSRHAPVPALPAQAASRSPQPAPALAAPPAAPAPAAAGARTSSPGRCLLRRRARMTWRAARGSEAAGGVERRAGSWLSDPRGAERVQDACTREGCERLNGWRPPRLCVPVRLHLSA